MSAWGLSALTPSVCVAQHKPTTTNTTTPKHLLGHLRYDTLLLAANYSENGEFGGHRELIKVYMRQQERAQLRNSPEWESFPLTAAWFLDSSQWAKPNRKFAFQKERLIKIEDEAVILQYMQALLSENLKDNGMTMSNGGNTFSITKAQRKDLQISYWDVHHAWSGFETLRKKLFGK